MLTLSLTVMLTALLLDNGLHSAEFVLSVNLFVYLVENHSYLFLYSLFYIS